MKFSPAELSKLLRANPELSVDGEYPSPREALWAQRVPAEQTFRTEHDLHAAIVAECDRLALDDPVYGLLFAIPNGGHRRRAVAGKLKAEGVRPGVPDLFLPVRRRGYGGLFIELKVGRNRPSPHQETWMERLRGQGYCCVVVRDRVADALDVLKWYLGGSEA